MAEGGGVDGERESVNCACKNATCDFKMFVFCCNAEHYKTLLAAFAKSSRPFSGTGDMSRLYLLCGVLSERGAS